MSEHRKELILFADDNKLLRMLNDEMLQEFGYKTLVAKNGEEAISLFKANSKEVDLAILDVVMPCISGLEAALKIQKINNELPIIFITGKDNTEFGDDLKNIRNYTVLNKPYTENKLKESIQLQIK